MNVKRLILWVAGFLALGLAAGAYGFMKLRPAPSQEQDVWIPMPLNAMDASEFPIRELLLSVNGHPENRDSLAWRCGSDMDNGLGEEYVLHIGDHAFVQNGRQWKVRAIPHGSQIEVQITDHSFWNLPPPPPPPGSPTGTAPQSKSKTLAHWVDRSDLEAIRQVWGSQDLWVAPQQDLGCLDGRAVLLEACVSGKYAARSRNCDDAGDESTELWKLLRAKFPSPESTPSEH
jgi:hypothetical protein